MIIIWILFYIILFVNEFYISFNFILENNNKELNEIYYNKFCKVKFELSKLIIILINKNKIKE